MDDYFQPKKKIKPINSVIQIESMNDDLKFSIWNILFYAVFNTPKFIDNYEGVPKIIRYYSFLQFSLYKKPVDDIGGDGKRVYDQIRKQYFLMPWNEVYDFLEATLRFLENDDREFLQEQLNLVFQQELAGYRFIDGVVTDIVDNLEIEAINEAIADNKFQEVSDHLKRALELLSDRKNPDYRNSIKESISAVETISKLAAGDKKAELSDALKALERQQKIHESLKSGFIKLYGYTSDGDGIRHSMMDQPNLNANDARYFLISCSCFVNYIKSKI